MAPITASMWSATEHKMELPAVWPSRASQTGME